MLHFVTLWRPLVPKLIKMEWYVMPLLGKQTHRLYPTVFEMWNFIFLTYGRNQLCLFTAQMTESDMLYSGQKNSCIRSILNLLRSIMEWFPPWLFWMRNSFWMIPPMHSGPHNIFMACFCSSSCNCDYYDYFCNHYNQLAWISHLCGMLPWVWWCWQLRCLVPGRCLRRVYAFIWHEQFLFWVFWWHRHDLHCILSMSMYPLLQFMKTNIVG